MGALHGGNRRESPAGTTHHLILNGVNCAFGSPIDLVGQHGTIEGHDLSSGIDTLLSASDSLVLILGKSGEFVVANNEAVRLSIKFVDDHIILVVDLESEFELFFGAIRNTIAGDVFQEVISDDVN